MGAGWIWDDGVMVHANPLIKSSTGLFKFWYSTKLLDYFPLTNSLLWVQWRLFGDQPAGYHIVNILLHGLCAAALWRVLLRLKVPGAFVAAAIFAVHPVGVASAAWISETKNTLSLLLGALAVLNYLHFEEKPAQRRWYVISLILFLLALLAKTSVVMIPVAILTLAHWRRGCISRNDLMRIAPMLCMSLALGLVTIYFQHENALDHTLTRIESWPTRLATSGWCAWFYLYKTIVPIQLSMIYPRWQVDAANWLHWLPLATWLVAIILAKRFRLVIGLYIILLLPVIGLVTMAFHAHSLVADHLQYIALIVPIATVTAISATHIKSRRTAILLAILVLLMLSAQTWARAQRLANERLLWTHTISLNDQAWAAHNNLGVIQSKDGQIDDAINHFQQVIKLQPDYAVGYFNLGDALRLKGQPNQAIEQYQMALALREDYFKAHNNLALLLLKQRKVEQAVTHLRAVVELQPGNAKFQNMLGNALSMVGRDRQALPHLKQAVALDSNNALFHSDLAETHASLNQFDQAIKHMQQALNLASPSQRPAMIDHLKKYRGN